MKQQLDEVRTLAIMLFKASEEKKREFPQHIWGAPRSWDDLPSESVAVWDAVAICAYRKLGGKQNPVKLMNTTYTNLERAVEGDW